MSDVENQRQKEHSKWGHDTSCGSDKCLRPRCIAALNRKPSKYSVPPIGKIFGSLTVTGLGKEWRSGLPVTWRCLCSCKSLTDVSASSLVTQGSPSKCRACVNRDLDKRDRDRDKMISVGGKLVGSMDLAPILQVPVSSVRRWDKQGLSGDEMLHKAAKLATNGKKRKYDYGAVDTTQELAERCAVPGSQIERWRLAGIIDEEILRRFTAELAL